MKLIVSGHDFSEVVEKITWSGDTKQVARELSFTVAHKADDPYLPKVKIDEGDPAQLLSDEGEILFLGPIFDIEFSASGSVISYTALDFLFYINNSEISRIFDGTPEEITAQICGELGIPLGAAAQTGIHVYMPCLGKGAYQAIMAAYTAASRQNGKKYIPVMRADKLHIIEKGALCGVVLDGSYNLTDASYSSSLRDMVNRVVLTDKNGNQISATEDTESRQEYGTVQKVLQQEDGEDASSQARSLLKTFTQSASVSAVGDVRAVSGYAVIVQEAVTGLYGKFYIESDSHTFEDGKHEMQLTLEFELMMDEQEIEQTEGG